VSSALKCFILFLLFTVEIRVKAEIIDLPKNCLKLAQYPCAVRWPNISRFYSFEPYHLLALAESEVIFIAPNNLRLVKGELYLSAKMSVHIDTLYGRVEIPSQSQLIVRKELQDVRISTLRQAVTVKRLGALEGDTVLAGYDMCIGPMALGRAQRTDRQAYDLKQVISVVSHLPEDIKALHGYLSELKLDWSNALFEVSRWSQAEAVRKIAAVNEKAARDERMKMQNDAENRRLRQLFRQKNEL
jgi:hypothetical protein